MKDVLVTGAGGGMGSATVRALLARGYRVFALDLTPLPEEENLISVATDVTSEESVANAYLKVGNTPTHSLP